MFCILICDIPTCHAGLPSLLLDGKSHPTSPSLGLPPSFPVPVVLAALRPFHSFHCALYVPRVQSLPVFCSVCSASEPIFVPKDSCHLLLVILSSFMMAFSLRVAFMYWYCVFTVPSVVCAGATAPVSVSIYSLISLLLTSPHVLCRSIYFMQSAHSSQVFVCLLVFHIVLFRICLFPPHVPLSCTKGFLRDSLSVSSFVPSSILVGS